MTELGTAQPQLVFNIYGQVFAEDGEDQGHLPTQTLKVQIKIKCAGDKGGFLDE